MAAATKIEHFINGKHQKGGSRRSDVYNPATGEVTGQVALGIEGRGRAGDRVIRRRIPRLVRHAVHAPRAHPVHVQAASR